MMLKRLVFIAFMTVNGAIATAETPGNIVIESHDILVDIDAHKGKASRLKVRDVYEITAERITETGAVAHFYDAHSSERVDKASSPGFEPIYRAAESGDLFYTGSRVCILPFEAKPGKKTKVSFETSCPEPELAGTIALADRYKTRILNVSVNIPAEIAGRATVRVFNLESIRPVTSTDGKGNVTVRLSLSDIDAFRSEPMSPEAQKTLPVMEIYTNLTNNDEVYAYTKSLTEDLSEIDPEVAAMARSITDSVSGGDIERINAIASWVRQNIRYVAIEHGLYGLSPDKASAVLAKRYGDCKGSANLIAAMLRAIGIDGRRVWIGTRGGVVAPFSQNPSLSASNHMIAAAVLPDTTVFIDGTTSFAPRGLIPYSIAGQECMVENGDSYILTHVPVDSHSPGNLHMEAELSIDGSRLSGDTRLTYTGIWRMIIENTLAEVNANRREMLVDAMFKSGRKSIVLTSPAIIESGEADAAESRLTAEVTDNEGVRAVSGRSKLYVMPRPLRMHHWSTVDEKDRRLPIDGGTPLTYSAQLTIAIPEGYEAESLPKRSDIDSRWFKGYVVYESGAEGKVVCTASLSPAEDYAKASEAPEWNKAVKEIERANSTALVLIRKDKQQIPQQ